jgi:hypothetical protein
LEIASDAAGLLLRLRDRPRALDWLALGTVGAGLAHKIWAEASALGALDPNEAFETEGPDAEWEAASPVFAGWILDHTTDERVLPHRADDSDCIVHARLGDEAIGWIENLETGAIDRGPYFLVERREQTLAALGQRLWEGARSSHVTVRDTGLQASATAGGELATSSLAELEIRLRRFADAGVHRSVLLLGPPGTGKTTAAGQLSERVGARSVRIDAAALERMLQRSSSWRYDGSEEPCHNLDAIVDCLRPDALLLDDIDRLIHGPELMAVIERARRQCPIVIATANCDGGMLGALLRPGRFDEIVRVEHPDPALVRRLLGPDHDLAERMSTWPIAWIAEYVTRREVLGRAEAERELSTLEARMDEIGERTKKENSQAQRRLRSV